MTHPHPLPHEAAPPAPESAMTEIDVRYRCGHTKTRTAHTAAEEVGRRNAAPRVECPDCTLATARGEPPLEERSPSRQPGYRKARAVVDFIEHACQYLADETVRACFREMPELNRRLDYASGGLDDLIARLAAEMMGREECPGCGVSRLPSTPCEVCGDGKLEDAP